MKRLKQELLLCDTSPTQYYVFQIFADRIITGRMMSDRVAN